MPETERNSWRKKRDDLKADLARLSVDETDLMEETEAFQQWQKKIVRFKEDLEITVKQFTQNSNATPNGTPAIADWLRL